MRGKNADGRKRVSISLSPEETIAIIKDRLQAVFHERLRGVVLYGSEARRAATAESDIDVLVLLNDPIAYGADLCACIDAVYPLVLEWERPINPEPVPIRDFEMEEWPLYKNAKAEGILV
jgi:predicted nucleotidyltransferase